MRKTVAFGFVGTVLDYGRTQSTLGKMAPHLLCLCQQETLVVHTAPNCCTMPSPRSLFEGLKEGYRQRLAGNGSRRRRNRDPQPVGLRRGLRSLARFRPAAIPSSRR